MKLVYRPVFLADVEQCADYLSTEADEAVAAAWYAALKKSLEHIQRVPGIGRVREDLPMPEIRTLNLRKYPNYLVFYRLENNAIELLRVRHGMMNLPELFSK
ncbi:MAG TPA: type II toxin-antitoxin system RelE/ParE family toxin [Verrucomicrobiae bacterium]|nr:type II toxin-antitoxin system RelE/ParE family toxin [Verrucomicrobiae bacterium]